MNRQRVFDRIDDNFQRHLQKIQELVRQPSISPEGVGIRECAELVKGYLSEIGCKEARLVETPGNPVVYGRYDAGAPRTVLVYLMYDTMPADEPGWMVPPLEARIVELEPFGKCIVSRGVYNTKGALRCFLNTCEAIQAVEGELPVNLIFVAEGEEELGSRHLPIFIQKYQAELKEADVLFFPFPAENRRGKVIYYLGVKGIVYFELELNGGDWGRGPIEFGIHGSNKAWIDSPVWRMIQALSTMTSQDGNNVLVDGFYENAAVPTTDDMELLEKLAETFDEEEVKEQMKVKEFVDGRRGIEALKLYLFRPTLNINGIWGGYTGPGTKTLLPHSITAKVDVRLVPNMNVDEVIPKIRRHLDSRGFPEVKIRLLESGYTWARMTHRHPYVQAVISAYREFGKEPEVWPTLAGSAPFSMFAAPPLSLPFVEGGMGHGALAHSPNEYFVISEGGPTGGLASMEKSFASVIDSLSKVDRPRSH